MAKGNINEKKLNKIHKSIKRAKMEGVLILSKPTVHSFLLPYLPELVHMTYESLHKGFMNIIPS